MPAGVTTGSDGSIGMSEVLDMSKLKAPPPDCDMLSAANTSGELCLRAATRLQAWHNVAGNQLDWGHPAEL